jgi:hypothetical protein
MATQITPQLSNFSSTPLRIGTIIFSDNSTLSSSNFDFNFINNIDTDIISVSDQVSRVKITPKGSIKSELVLEPKNNGALLRTSQGNVRGINATDLQKTTTNDKIASGDYSVIAGGTNNSNNGEYSNIVGGQGNIIESNLAVIGGGAGNFINGSSSNILGGTANSINGEYSSILGGRFNSITNENGCIIGGVYNTINKRNCYILGSNITTPQEDYTYVNNLSSSDFVHTRALRFSDGTTQTTAWLGTNNTVGFTPVQQGGGNGQGLNKIYIGFGSSKLKLQIDNTDYSSVWPIDINGNAETSTLALCALTATTAVGYLKSEGGVDQSVDGSVQFETVSVSDAIVFADGSSISTSYTSNTTIELFSEQKGAEGYTCAYTSDKRVIVWGKSDWLNNGRGVWPPQSVPFEGDYLNSTTELGVVKLICGKNTIIALLSDGTLWYCGNRKIVNSDLNSRTRVFRRVTIAQGVSVEDFNFVETGSTDLTTGSRFIVAVITANKDLYIWGTNDSGCCGVGNNSPVTLPTNITRFQGNTKQIDIKLTIRNGSYVGFVSVLTYDEQLWSAGIGTYKTLSTGNTSSSNIFVRARTNSTQFLKALEIFDTNYNFIEGVFVKGLDILNNQRLYICGLSFTGVSNDDNSYYNLIQELYQPLKVKVVCYVASKCALIIAKKASADDNPNQLFLLGRDITGTLGTELTLKEHTTILEPKDIVISTGINEQNVSMILNQENEAYICGFYDVNTFESGAVKSQGKININGVLDASVISNNTGVNNMLLKTAKNDIFTIVVNGSYVVNNETVVDSLPIKITNFL